MKLRPMLLRRTQSHVSIHKGADEIVISKHGVSLTCDILSELMKGFQDKQLKRIGEMFFIQKRSVRDIALECVISEQDVLKSIRMIKLVIARAVITLEDDHQTMTKKPT